MVKELLLASISMLCFQQYAAAQAKIKYAIIGDTSQYRIKEAGEISKAIGSRYIRRATPVEVKRIVNGNEYLAQWYGSNQPIYYVLRQEAFPIVKPVGGAHARVFIVPANIAKVHFNNHNIYVTPTGGCLQGRCGPCAPTAPAGNGSDQIPGECMIGVPLSPSTPRR